MKKMFGSDSDEDAEDPDDGGDFDDYDDESDDHEFDEFKEYPEDIDLLPRDDYDDRDYDRYRDDYDDDGRERYRDERDDRDRYDEDPDMYRNRGSYSKEVGDIDRYRDIKKERNEDMGRSRKNTYIPRDRNRFAFGRFIFSLMVVCLVLMMFIKVALPKIVKKAKKAAADKAVEIMYDNVEKIAGKNPKVKEALESMSEEDKEKVSEIVAEHMDAETMTDVMEYVNKNDQAGLVEYAAKNFSPEEMNEFKDLYEKYGDK